MLKVVLFDHRGFVDVVVSGNPVVVGNPRQLPDVADIVLQMFMLKNTVYPYLYCLWIK